MAIRISVIMRVEQVGDGAGTALLGQNQAEYPGYGSSLTYGAVGSGQTLELRVAEAVPGGDSPTSGNFTTALTAAAADLGTLLSTAGAYSGGTATPLSLIQAWYTGGV